MQQEIKQKQFCRLTGLTRKALLVYEEKGVLTPNRIDIETGYRYYSEDEVHRGVKIAFLRSLSFSVNEIRALIDNELGCSEILHLKEAALSQELHRIRNGLRFIELNRNYPFPFSEDLRETSLPLYQVAVIEGRGTARDISVHHKLLSRQLIQEGVEQRSAPGTYYFADSSVHELHFKVFVPIVGDWFLGNNSCVVENFGIPRYTFLRHYGTYELLASCYRELLTQLNELEIPTTGEYIEIYQNRAESLNSSDYTTLITDIGVPTWL